MIENTNNELDALFVNQKKAFLANQYPSYEERLGWLQSLEKMMVDLRQPLRDAMEQDFGNHPPLITDMFETGGILRSTRAALAAA